MKNASLITEVEDLNRKVREMLEQVREKDRQITKLQGNYSKVRTLCMYHWLQGRHSISRLLS